jgi:hypothetical protein
MAHPIREVFFVVEITLYYIWTEVGYTSLVYTDLSIITNKHNQSFLVVLLYITCNAQGLSYLSIKFLSISASHKYCLFGRFLVKTNLSRKCRFGFMRSQL